MVSANKIVLCAHSIVRWVCH